MSKRFGRNQKRKARDEITRLSEELDTAITGGFARATGRWPALDPLIGIPISIDIVDSEDAFAISRKAKIRFIIPDEKVRKGVLYHLAYSGLVEWRGIIWAPARFEPANCDTFRQVSIFELNLGALGRHDPKGERKIITQHNHPMIGRYVA